MRVLVARTPWAREGLMMELPAAPRVGEHIQVGGGAIKKIKKIIWVNDPQVKVLVITK